jgi:hypothetical protein
LGWKRCTAFIVKANYKSIDLLIVAKHCTADKYIPVFVQVKNYTSVITKNAALKIFTSMQKLNIDNCTLFKNSPVVCLVIATGKVLSKTGGNIKPIQLYTNFNNNNLQSNMKLKSADIINSNPKPADVLMTLSIDEFELLSENEKALLIDLSQLPIEMKDKHFLEMFGGLSDCLEVKDKYPYYIDKKQEEKDEEELPLSLENINVNV